MELELRTLTINDLTFDDTLMSVTGYVNKTGEPSAVLGSGDNKFREIIEPGVFTSALQNADIVDFYDEHDPSRVLATTKNGTLSLKEDQTGLLMNAHIIKTSWGKDAYELITSGVITGMSFGMQVLDDSWSVGDDGVAVRTVKAIKLFEVSAVRHPAYPTSTLEARGITVVGDIKVPENLQKEEVRSLDNETLNKSISSLTDVVSDLTDRLKDLLAFVDEFRSEKTEQVEKRDDSDDSDTPTVEEDSTEEKPKQVTVPDNKKKTTKNPDTDITETEETDPKETEKKTNTQKTDEKRSLDANQTLDSFKKFFNI